MRVSILDIALREFHNLDFQIQSKFRKQFEILESGENLDRNNFKKLSGTELSEFRVKYNGNIYRGICGSINKNKLIVLFFLKKTQKIPLNYIKLANKRFIKYKNLAYEQFKK